MKKKDVLKSDVVDLLFEGRNKSYGAYALRRQYRRQLAKAFVYTVSAMLLLVFLPYIIAMLRPDAFETDTPVVMTEYSTEVPKGALTPTYIPPPPPAPKPANLVPRVVADSVPEVKQQPKTTQVTDDKTAKTQPTKDTVRKAPGTGNPDGDPNQVFIDYDNAPSWASHDYPDANAYLSKNIKMPELEILQHHFGIVRVTAIVNADGSIAEPKISKGLSPVLNAEALRAVKAMPKWNPGMRHQHAVRTYVIINVNFTTPDNMSTQK